MEETIFTVEKEFEGIRIDKYLSEVFKDKSRSYLQGLIEKGNIKVNNKDIKSNYKLREFDDISVILPEPISISNLFRYSKNKKWYNYLIL